MMVLEHQEHIVESVAVLLGPNIIFIYLEYDGPGASGSHSGECGCIAGPKYDFCIFRI